MKYNKAYIIYKRCDFKSMMMKLFCAAIIMFHASFLISCSDDDSNTGGNGESKYTSEEPTTDQLYVRVTADLPAASLSQFDDKSTGAALIRRLPRVTSTIQEDTKFVLLKGSDVSSQSDAVIAQMAQVLLYGGYVAVETPTEEQLNTFFDRIDKGISTAVVDYVDDVFDLTPEQTEATVNASIAGRMETRRANLSSLTRGSADQTISAELVIFGATDYFYQEPDNSSDKMTIYATDTDGYVVEDAYETSYAGRLQTAYHFGLFADGAAQWLNDLEAAKQEEAERGEIAQGKAILATNGRQAINDLESAVETFTHYQNIDYKNQNNQPCYKAQACKTTISYWGAHNMTNNRDYYFVSQKVLLSMGPVNGIDLFNARGQKEDYWLVNRSWKNYDLTYGYYLTRYETSMDLKGNKGTINIEAATPETANQSVTESVNLTSSSSSTTGGGVIASVTGGWTFDRGLNLSVEAGGQYIHGSSKGSSFAMGNSKDIKDLSVQKNTSGTKAKWTYSGKNLQVNGQPGKWTHDVAPEILVNDANIANDVCWSVENPSGNYTLEVQSQPELGILLLQSSTGNRAVERTKTSLDTYTHQLKKPNRYMQTWRMFIVINEWMDGAKYTSGVQSRLEEDFKNSFSDIYTDMFNICETEANSVLLATAIIKNAKRVLDSNKDQLPGIAEGRGVKKFTIYWRCDDTNVKLRNAYVVEVK